MSSMILTDTMSKTGRMKSLLVKKVERKDGGEYSLVIVESPAKCRKIEEFLGPGYRCVASMGHFREIASLSDINIDEEAGALAIKYTNLKTAPMRKAISTMKSEAAQASEVIIATDDDREGEAIGWHVCSLLKLNVATTRRAIFHEITQDAVVTGVERSVDTRLNMSIVEAQKARQVIDMSIGYGVSPALWASGISGPGKKKGPSLSAGRCQTPSLRLVIDESEASQNSADTSVTFKVHGLFTGKNIRFDLTHSFDTKEEPILISFLDTTLTHVHKLLPSPPQKVSIRAAPKPLTTSRLQQSSSNTFSLSPKQTMSSCQRLYEAGFITYMRTDVSAYSAEFVDATKRYIEQTFNDVRYVSQTVDTLVSSGAGAHESIRPTSARLRTLPSTVTDAYDRKVYGLIWETAIGSCMAPAEYNRLVVRVNAPEHDYHYEATTESPIFLGWEILHPRAKETVNKEAHEYAYLEALSSSTFPDTVPYTFVRAVGTPTAPRPLPTEARLVRLLEERGIGRPSTFASLVEKIQDRGYVKRGNVAGTSVECETYEVISGSKDITVEVNERIIGAEKNKMLAQPLGLAVSEYLQTHFVGLFAYDYTSAMETQLEAIALGDSGSKSSVALCAEVRRTVAAAVEAAPKAPPVVVSEDVETETETETGWEYDGLPVMVKLGRFGLFARWGENNVKLPFGNRPRDNIRYDEVVDVLKKWPGKHSCNYTKPGGQYKKYYGKK